MIEEQKFDWYPGGIAAKPYTTPVTFEDIYQCITASDELQEKTQEIRFIIASNKAGARNLKHQLPAFKPGRLIDNKMSPYCFLDFDHIDDMTAAKVKLIKGKHGELLVMLSESASGYGLHAIYKRPKDTTYPVAWKLFADNAKALGLTADEQICTSGNMCFVAFDTNCYFNQNL